MSEEFSQPLLAPFEMSPAQVYNLGGRSPFLLLGDHAGNAVPAALGTLGLERWELDRHIAWDLGIAELGRLLAEMLDAPFISQTYSRLVIDCNRDPARGDAIVKVSDGTVVPGNWSLSIHSRNARATAIHRPYHEAVAQLLASRDRSECPTVVVSLHSFTPIMDGFTRPWQIGVLHERGHHRLARALLKVLSRQDNLAVGDNQPYAMDGTDYTVPRHAYGADRLCVEFEIRQDLLATRQGRKHWAVKLHDWLNAGAENLL
jgi:predicted N-formylglutamate amidohydrolase